MAPPFVTGSAKASLLPCADRVSQIRKLSHSRFYGFFTLWVMVDVLTC